MAELPGSIDSIYSMVNLSYYYPDGTPALSEVSAIINRGDRLALLGSNGSGKSTLLKLLDGLLLASAGSLAAFGTELNDESMRDIQFSKAFRQRVGFIFQRSDVQLFSPTVWDEIAFGPLQMGLSAAEVTQRVEDVIKMLTLESLKDRPPYRLSGGEQKKVAIASVLSMNPDVLLLDEPTAGLDPLTQRWFMDLLVRLQQTGKTTVLATHELHLLPELADRVLVLGSDHTVIREASAEAVLADHDLLHRANLSHYHGGAVPYFRHSHP